MVVSERVILSSLLDEVLNHVSLCDKEHLFNLEVLHLDFLGSIHLELPSRAEEKLLVEAGRRREADVPADCLDALVDLLLEVWDLVVDNREVRMAYPGVDQSLIQILGNI